MALSEKKTSTPAARQRVGAVVTFYVLLLALNAPALHEAIQRQPFGPTRTFWLAATKPFANASRTLRLDRPRNWIRDTLGRAINN